LTDLGVDGNVILKIHFIKFTPTTAQYFDIEICKR
jgi:hypothetical protein